MCITFMYACTYMYSALTIVTLIVELIDKHVALLERILGTDGPEKKQLWMCICIYTCYCTLYVQRCLHVLSVCFNHAAHTVHQAYMHHTYIHVRTQHTLSVCCQSVVDHVPCYLLFDKKQKRAPWCKCFACAQ